MCSTADQHTCCEMMLGSLEAEGARHFCIEHGCNHNICSGKPSGSDAGVKMDDADDMDEDHDHDTAIDLWGSGGATQWGKDEDEYDAFASGVNKWSKDEDEDEDEVDSDRDGAASASAILPSRSRQRQQRGLAWSPPNWGAPKYTEPKPYYQPPTNNYYPPSAPTPYYPAAPEFVETCCSSNERVCPMDFPMQKQVLLSGKVRVCCFTSRVNGGGGYSPYSYGYGGGGYYRGGGGGYQYQAQTSPRYGGGYGNRKLQYGYAYGRGGTYGQQPSYHGDSYAFGGGLPAQCPATPLPTPVPSPAPSPHGTISGSMWLDLNNDGIKDDDEPGIGARKVELYLQSAVRGRILHDDNSPVSQAVTDSNGDYTLSTPSDSSYVVRFNLFNTEAECCGPSYRGLDNDINREGSQCAAYYDTNIIEAESTQITNVNGGFVCPLCQGDWDVIVNNADPIPDSPGFDGKNFSSYNAASVNTEGLVVFRARSTGGGNPSTGIFVRDMYDEDSTIRRQAGRRTTVPQPNNLDTKFIEFPSFPRMSINDDNIATRGNHGPVWKYVKDGNETRAGNTGLYFNLAAKYEIETANVRLNLQTGVAKLGNVPEFEIYQVPGLEITGVVFDVFPGSPAIQDDSTIAFKGNYAKSGVSQTGVFYRQLDGAGQLFVVANSQTNIPEPSTNCNTTTFGSTASPSIVDSKMVFRGLDNEDDPGCGGIYMAEMDSSNYPMLKSLVSLETTVPGEKGGATFTSFGEGLSYDGRAVGFWAGWGDELETISLCCPKTGNKDRRNFCLKNDPNTICDNSTAPDGCDSGCYQNMAVPVNQGIFVYDSEDDSIKAVAKGSTKKGKDFIFWNYSGKPPEAGPTDETDSAEPPRWRSSATVALSQHNSVAYKLKDEDRGSVGIYHSKDEGDNSKIIVETGQKCSILDAEGVASDGVSLLVESVSMERDSFRDSNLVVSVACAIEVTDVEEDEEVEGDWGGIYLTRVCPPLT